MKSGILGGGLTGLALASMVEGDCEVLEKEASPGGLCRTFQEKGFRFDIGGHILFSKNEEILKRVLEQLGDNVEKRRRNNKILFNGRFVKYPFENGLNELAKENIFDCLIGFLKNPHPAPTNFKDWILHTFGDGFASKYLIPYNETYLGFSNAGKSRIDHFKEIIASFDIPVTVRVSLGQDISAACGQLAVAKTKS